jgi:tRNA U34 5-carboxymethylaminomethyl modifying enzyme MnmG/GidA
MQKIKSIINKWLESNQGKDILTVIIVILVGLGSFELGRLSKQNTSPNIETSSVQVSNYSDQPANAISAMNPINNEPIKTSEVSSITIPDPLNTKTTINTNTSTKPFFASSRGKKYYPVNCSAGKNIKQSNRIYFSTESNAQKAGYTLSSSCN